MTPNPNPNPTPPAEQVSTEEEREGLRAKLDEGEEWLYEEVRSFP